MTALKSPTLLGVLAFLAFWNFSPSFGTPWYYHQTDRLAFSQEFIGILGAITSVGGVGGALLYWRRIAAFPLRRQLVLGIWMGAAGLLLYLALVRPSPWSHALAIAIELVFGAASMVALLASLTLAARACPVRAEGFTFAALMAAMNGVTEIGAIVGARLYTNVLDKAMAPLIVISAAFTLACLLLLPVLVRTTEDTATP